MAITQTSKPPIIRPDCPYCGGKFKGRRKWYQWDRANCKCGASLECIDYKNTFITLPPSKKAEKK